MKRTCLIFALFLLSSCSPGERRPQIAALSDLPINIDLDFEYRPEGWPMGLSVGQTDAPPLTEDPQEPLIKEPQYRSSRHLYGHILLGNSKDNRISFVIDDMDKPTWVVWFDINNNEDLTDDGPPLVNKGTLRMGAIVSLEIPVADLGSRIVRPYRFWFWVNEHDGGLYPRFYAACHYRKTLLLNGRSYTAVVFEMFRHDALYRESGLWIDLDGNGKLDGDKEHFNDGDAVNTGNGAFRLVLAYP